MPGKSGLTARELSRSASLDPEASGELLDTLVRAELWTASYERIVEAGGRPSKRYYPKAG